MNNNKVKIVFALLASLWIISCGKNTNNDIDFDFSTLRKSKIKSNIDNENKKGGQPGKESFIRELVPYKNNKEILSITKFGKKDPFSKGSQENKINLNLKLTGFLNTDSNKYAFVRYLNNKGTITEGSIGGVNTFLLPNGAKVITIDSKQNQLKISLDNEDFIFEL